MLTQVTSQEQKRQLAARSLNRTHYVAFYNKSAHNCTTRCQYNHYNSPTQYVNKTRPLPMKQAKDLTSRCTAFKII